MIDITAVMMHRFRIWLFNMATEQYPIGNIRPLMSLLLTHVK